jgi:hypothetical protein
MYRLLSQVTVDQQRAAVRLCASGAIAAGTRPQRGRDYPTGCHLRPGGLSRLSHAVPLTACRDVPGEEEDGQECPSYTVVGWTFLSVFFLAFRRRFGLVRS